jgi:hypothetical protein
MTTATDKQINFLKTLEERANENELYSRLFVAGEAPASKEEASVRISALKENEWLGLDRARVAKALEIAKEHKDLARKENRLFIFEDYRLEELEECLAKWEEKRGSGTLRFALGDLASALFDFYSYWASEIGRLHRVRDAERIAQLEAEAQTERERQAAADPLFQVPAWKR